MQSAPALPEFFNTFSYDPPALFSAARTTYRETPLAASGGVFRSSGEVMCRDEDRKAAENQC
jgi:hypothetical protein